MTSTKQLLRFLFIAFLYSDLQLITSAMLTPPVCGAAYGLRKVCGYKYITRGRCMARGCCFEFTSALGVPTCYRRVQYYVRSFSVATPPPHRYSWMPQTSQSQITPPQPRSNSPPINAPPSGMSSLMNTYLQVNKNNNAGASNSKRLDCTVHPTARRDCGYPGIGATACRSNNCCYDSRYVGAPWCFRPAQEPTTQGPRDTPHTYPSPYIRQGGLNDTETATEDNSYPTPNNFATATELIEPPIPTEAYDDRTRSAQNATEYFNTETTESFPSYRPTTELTTTTEVLPPFKDPILPPVKDEPITQRPEPERQVTVSHQNATDWVLPPSPEPTPESNNKNSRTPINDISNVLVWVKMVSKLRNENKNSANKPTESPHTCSRSSKSSCCANNPNGPCCEFSQPSHELSRSTPLRRIVGGGRAGRLGASVAYLTLNKYDYQFCGGTLIADDWVVTAAHCVLDYCNKRKPVQEIIVKLGKIHKANSFQDKYQQTRRADRVVCHPENCKASEQPRLNDIALVHLSKRVSVNAYVSPASLPLAGETPIMGRRCISLGWGETRGSGYDTSLKEVQVPLHSNELCNKPSWRGCVVRACMMCAGELRKEACAGDSGGPLFCERANGRFALHGVYSWGRCGVVAKKPAVYVRFSYYINWINNIIYFNSAT